MLTKSEMISTMNHAIQKIEESGPNEIADGLRETIKQLEQHDWKTELEIEGEGNEEHGEDEDDLYFVVYRGIEYKCINTHITSLFPNDKVIVYNGMNLEGVGNFIDRKFLYDEGRAYYSVNISITVPHPLNYNDIFDLDSACTILKVIDERPDSEYLKLADRQAHLDKVCFGDITKLTTKYHRLDIKRVNSDIIRISGLYKDVMVFAEDYSVAQNVMIDD